MKLLLLFCLFFRRAYADDNDHHLILKVYPRRTKVEGSKREEVRQREMKSKRVEVIHGEIYTGITKTVIEENEKENVHVRGEEALERIEASCEIISISARKEGGSSTYETPEQKITSLKRWEPKKRSRDAFSESENYYKARKSDEISETGLVCVQDDPESPKMRKVELYEERTNAEAHYRDAPSFPKIDFATQETVCDSSSPKGYVMWIRKSAQFRSFFSFTLLVTLLAHTRITRNLPTVSSLFLLSRQNFCQDISASDEQRTPRSLSNGR